jgi:hypothetical protein
VKDEFSIPSGGDKVFPFDVIENDTVHGYLTLTQGEQITCFCLIDDENLQKWKSNQTCEFIYYVGNSAGENFYLWMPYTGSCNFVVVNHLGYTIWVRAEIIVSRWEK